MTTKAKGPAEAATSTPSHVSTQAIGLENMETNTTPSAKRPDVSLLERATKANESASTAFAIIQICRAAAEFADDQPDYNLGRDVPANISVALKHVNDLVLDMTDVVERVLRMERA